MKRLKTILLAVAFAAVMPLALTSCNKKEEPAAPVKTEDTKTDEAKTEDTKTDEAKTDEPAPAKKSEHPEHPGN